MSLTQKYHPLIRKKLHQAKLAELAQRNGKTGVIHLMAFGISVYLSPMKDSHPLFWQVLLTILFVGVALRTVLCIPKVQEKIRPGAWIFFFTSLTICLFSVWAAWTSVGFMVLGLDHSMYFCCLVLAGILSGAVMGFAPSKALMISVTLVSLIPALAVLVSLQTTETNAVALMYSFYGIYLISLARQVNRDYTGAVMNRELTDQSKQVIEGILHSVPGMVSCVDHDLNYVWSNRKLDERFGINVMNKVKTLGAYSQNDEFPAFVRKFIASGKEVDHMEYQMQFPGGPCWMMVFLSSYKEYGEGRVLIVAYDIEGMKTAEKELEKQRLLTMESAKLATLGEMSAGIAHEINNPLAVMMGRADMMISDLKRGSAAEPELLLGNLEKIVKSSQRIAKIVKGLKTFSRNGDKDEFQSANVETMVQDVLDFSRERFKSNNIEFKVQIEQGLSIDCRSTQIEQVLLNLFSNSFDAIVHSPNPWILVEGYQDGAYVQISVTDSGNGIDPKILAKMMQPFFTTKEVGKGTGLGLSISLGIIESHKGEFFCDTNCTNTRFVVRIPRVQKAVA